MCVCDEGLTPRLCCLLVVMEEEEEGREEVEKEERRDGRGVHSSEEPSCERLLGECGDGILNIFNERTDMLLGDNTLGEKLMVNPFSLREE